MPVTIFKQRRAKLPLRVDATAKAWMVGLKFGRGNAKLGKDVYTISLPAGHTCPGAHLCKGRVNFNTNKLEDGPHQKFRCFAAALEVAFKGFRDNNRRNLSLLSRCKSSAEMRNLILRSLPKKARKIRVHVSGDFFSQKYFDAWMDVARLTPHVAFYAYTKSFPFWLDWLRRYSELPRNFTLTASEGSKFDNLIRKDWVTARVVFSPSQARKARLPVDHDDSHAQKQRGSFALLLHGVQPAGSDASEALKIMKEQGVEFSYKRK